jgi:hypothetical protein
LFEKPPFDKPGRPRTQGQPSPYRGAPYEPAPPQAAPVRITSFAERTSGHDEHLGFLLRDMRLALPMTPGELALRVGSSVEVIKTLEQGRLRALPHWDETQHVVCGLCALHHVDPRPILNRIIEQTSSTSLGAPPVRGPGSLQRAGRRSGDDPAHGEAEPPRQKRQAVAPKPAKKAPKPWRTPRISQGPGRVLMAVAGPMVMVAAAVWAVQAQPRALRASIEVLPHSIAQPMLSALDAMAIRLARRQDGMRWIEVADPSSRKADKLQVGSR